MALAAQATLAVQEADEGQNEQSGCLCDWKCQSKREIFHIIKRNYEFLKRGHKMPYEENEKGFIETKDFLAMEINPKFCTSTVIDKDGTQWFCVFERCYSIG